MQEGGIPCSKGHKAGHTERCRGIEDESIEHGIEDVSHCTGKNHRQHDDVSRGVFLLEHLPNIPSDSGDGYKTEKTEHQFIEEGHAIGHTIVFDKADVEPIGDVNRLTKTEMGLDLNLNNLIYEKNGSYQDKGQDTIG